MIKRIELIDFESHKHTVIDDFSDGLNLIVGDSNSGKTSIIRAIKLVAYNEFDAGCVRVGASRCIVRVDTERGYVKVTRGPKVNVWETCRTGCKPVTFEKVGKNIVPEASEIIGLKMVSLGDVEFPVNVMSQLESHFMLSGVGDKNATGSMRAQIVDEISGLSGFEQLVKEVAADNLRIAKVKNEALARKAEIEPLLTDENWIKAEKQSLKSTETELSLYSEDKKTSESVETYLDKSTSASNRLAGSRKSLSALPETESANAMIDKAERWFRGYGQVEEFKKRYESYREKLRKSSERISVLPECAKASTLLIVAEKTFDALSQIESLISKHSDSVFSINAKKDRLNKLPLSESIGGFIEQSQKDSQTLVLVSELFSKYKSACDKLAEKKSLSLPDSEAAVSELNLSEKNAAVADDIASFKSRSSSASVKLNELKGRLESIEAELKAANDELERQMKDVKVCPVTMKPLNRFCLEQGVN